MQDILNLIIITAKQHGARFVSVKGYQNNEGEVSDYVINTGIEYENIVLRDIEKLKAIQYNDELKEKARMELLSSLEQNLTAETRSNQSEAQRDSYTHITPNIKVHNGTNELYVVGQRVHKKVLVPVERKPTNKRALTLKKDEIKKELGLGTGNYRNFKLGKIAEMRISGNVLKFKSFDVVLSENEATVE